MSEWGAAIAALLTLIGWGVKQWLTGAPERKKEAEDDERQKTRNAISSGDVVAANSVVDRLLPTDGMPTTGTTSDSPERQHSDASIAERLNNVLKP